MYAGWIKYRGFDYNVGDCDVSFVYKPGDGEKAVSGSWSQIVLPDQSRTKIYREGDEIEEGMAIKAALKERIEHYYDVFEKDNKNAVAREGLKNILNGCYGIPKQNMDDNSIDQAIFVARLNNESWRLIEFFDE